MKTILVAGGGPAAVSYLAQFLREYKDMELDEAVTIHVFEKSEAIGPGLPYADKSESWILNLPASMMGIERQQNNDFVNWLKKHDPDAIKDTHFPPRSCFGAYLMFRARELQEDASYPNVKVHYHTNQEVIGIKKKDGQFSVIAKSTSDSDKMILEEGDTLILATGHLSSALFPNLFGVSGYWEHPWSKQLYDSVKPEDSVWVVGTGPSAIDTCLRLLDEGKVTSVDMISRSGALPGVLSEASLEGPPYPLRHFNFADIIMKANRGLRDLSFLDLARRLWADIKEAEEETSGNVLTENDIVKTYGDLDPQIWIDREIKAAQKGPRPHQRVLYAAFPYISTLWGHLPVKDKLEFLRYKTTFLRYLSAMPLPNAVKLQGYMKKNLIRVHGGMHGVSECTKRRGSFVISSQEKGDSLQHFPTVVINATGPSTEIYTDPLITALIRGRLVQKHPAGGIDVDPDTLLAVDADGDVHSNLHILGELTSGPCFRQMDMGLIATQAERVALGTVRRLKALELQRKRRSNNNTSDERIVDDARNVLDGNFDDADSVKTNDFNDLNIATLARPVNVDLQSRGPLLGRTPVLGRTLGPLFEKNGTKKRMSTAVSMFVPLERPQFVYPLRHTELPRRQRFFPTVPASVPPQSNAGLAGSSQRFFQTVPKNRLGRTASAVVGGTVLAFGIGFGRAGSK